ncbi:MAG: FprA family A-type flavoprotein, partial [Acutalibacteraceae bacterium]
IIPSGVSYNSYVIFDDKIAVMDTVDKRKTDEWLENLGNALKDKTPAYLIIDHMEPDHAGSIPAFLKKYPDTTLVGNAKTFSFLTQFTGIESDNKVVVKEGDTLSLGSHTLTFVMAPMVHWPEAMVSYESSEKVLFSADAFGKFGALDADEGWDCEARRYYFNIVGKYGVQVQALLKKASALDIEIICPLHGPILTENLQKYLSLYDIWSKYEPEDIGVFVAYSSIHGNTKEAAKYLAQKLKEKTDKRVSVADLTREDLAECVEDAFRHSILVTLSSSYDGGLFPPMEDFLSHLKAKNFQKRKVAMVENGTWAPSAGRVMKEYFDSMKNIDIVSDTITIRSSVKESDKASLDALADALVKEL